MRKLFISLSLLALLTFISKSQSQAQSVGDWQTLGVPQGLWNAGANWQTWNGSAWVTSSGSTPGTSYPNTNTTKITLITGTVLTNLTSSGTIYANQLTIQAGANLCINKGTMTILHNGATTYDWDIFGALTLVGTSGSTIALSNNAVITVENGGVMTNLSGTTSEAFLDYTNVNMNFLNGSLFVLTGTKAGTIPYATWQPGSTTLFIPSAAGAYFPGQFINQSYNNFIWNWPTQNNKTGGSGNAGNVTIANTFGIYNAGGQVIEDVPGSGGTMIASNIVVTNAVWYPTASPGNSDINISGNFIIDSASTFKINSGTGFGFMVFDGTTPQTFGLYGVNGSEANFNWTINAGSTVNFNTGLTISGGTATSGILTNNGVANLQGNSIVDDNLLYGSGVFSNATGAAVFTVGGGAFSGTIAGGAGTINLNKNSTNILVLTGTNTCAGGATIVAGTLALTGSASLVGTPTINVASGAVLDISGLTGSFTLAAGQTLTGGGSINGSVAVANNSTARVHPGGGGTVATTLVFSNNLALGAASIPEFDLSSSHTGANDQIVLSGSSAALNGNGASITINSAGTLDSANYVLFNVPAGSVASGFAATPVWAGTTPANASSYSIVTSGTQVILQYTAPSGSQPKFTGLNVSGSNLVLSGSNGVASTTYYVVTTTSLAPPVTWTPVATNQFDGNGGFSYTNAINPATPTQFFTIHE